jgi:hypothetical protein
MALKDFFSINMPYGMQKNENGEWFVFNREYVPLGFNDSMVSSNYSSTQLFDLLPVYTSFKSMGDVKLETLVGDTKLIHRRADGSVFKVFFYNDSTDPVASPVYWQRYFKIIKALSSCQAKALKK